jgi:hypothetical protein
MFGPTRKSELELYIVDCNRRLAPMDLVCCIPLRIHVSRLGVKWDAVRGDGWSGIFGIEEFEWTVRNVVWANEEHWP